MGPKNDSFMKSTLLNLTKRPNNLCLTFLLVLLQTVWYNEIQEEHKITRSEFPRGGE